MKRTPCLFLMIAAACAAADADTADAFGRAANQSIHILPAELFAADQRDHGLPSLGYVNRERWQALVCGDKCSLVEVRLLTRAVEVTPYDSEPVPGQTLDLDEKPRGTLIALLRGLPDDAKSSPETKLHAGVGPYPPPRTRGSLEIDIPDSGGARIVPRLPRGAAPETPLNVYLEAGGRRQLLDTLQVDAVVGYEGLSVGARLLRWAGVLDGDGRLDLIMSFSSRVGEEQSAVLFLSSAAREGELVRAVARFGYFPVELAGC